MVYIKHLYIMIYGEAGLGGSGISLAYKVTIMDKTKYSNIKLIITSVDGVFTDGSSTYNSSGSITHKTYVNKDFSALIRLSEYFGIVVVSSYSEVNSAVFSKFGFGLYYTKNKKKKINQVIRAKNLMPDNCIYIGSDLQDVPCVRTVPLSFCPKTAFEEVKEVATVIPLAGGTGIVYYLYRLLLSEIMLRNKFCAGE